METRQQRKLLRSQNPLTFAPQQRAALHDVRAAAGQTFAAAATAHFSDALQRASLRTLQVNIGKLCNQTCTHCHVDAGPDRRENMSAQTVDQVIRFLSMSPVGTLDITGGAPEMNPHFRRLVTAATSLGKKVLDRCNLTILVAKGYQDLPAFLAEHDVHVIASLPCYLEENCDAQRGDGVFARSLDGIRQLNLVGYGQPNSQLQLDLVFNPQGTALPPDQPSLERAYKTHLLEHYGIQFNRLLTITNMPVSRFLDQLLASQRLELYMHNLVQHFNPNTLSGLMCRWLVSVDWQGFLYDCDFNQMLDLPLTSDQGRLHISQVTDAILEGRAIQTGNHCFGCTAGYGSSCTGALA